MANVRFYRLETLPAYEAAKHQGVFVHLTQADSTHPIGLWFGGSQDWEYLTNDPNAVKIDEKTLLRATSEDASDFKIEEGSIYVKDDLIDTAFTTTIGVGYLKQGTEIAKGTTIEKLLKDILTTLLYPQIDKDPSSTLNIGSGAGETVFVGDDITFPGANITTFNGSYKSVDPKTGTDFSEMVLQEPTGVFFNHETITTQTNCNYNTNTGSASKGSDDSTDPIESRSVKIDSQTVPAILGENKVIYTATSHHTASTNTGLKSDETPASLSIAAGNPRVANSGNSKINTGVLPLFVNFEGEFNQTGGIASSGDDAVNTWVAIEPAAVTNTNRTIVDNVYNSNVIRISTLGTSPENQLTVWFPSGEVESVKVWNTSSGKFDSDVPYKTLGDVEIEFANGKYNYHVVQIDRTNAVGSADYKFTFSENQSTNK